MPSPDVTQYVDLTIYDKDAQDVYEEAETNARIRIPEWVPQEGNTEVVLMESLALEVGDAIFSINRLPGAIMEVLMQFYGITRDLGAPATTTFTFNVSDTIGHDIPAGTRVQVAIGGGYDPVTFATDEVLTIPAGSLTGTVSATAQTNTSLVNNIATGTVAGLLDAIVYVDTVIVASIITGGRDQEDDTAWMTRAMQRFQRLSEVLVLPQHFTEAALENPFVYRATTIDNYDPSSGNSPGGDPGHVTVAVYGPDGVVSDTDKTTLATQFADEAASNLAVHIIDPTVTAIDVTATVVTDLGYTTDQVQQNVIDALTTYFSTNTWNWDTVVRLNSLIAYIGAVDGVAYVQSITTPAADLALAGVAPLTTAGVFTITAVSS